MYPLFESICLQDGKLLHAKWHALRFENTFQTYFNRTPSFDLLGPFDIPKEFCNGTVKLKILYNENSRILKFKHYKIKNIQSLKIQTTKDLDYSLKYCRRDSLEALFARRGDCDDILIVNKGKITDSSYANIVFFDGNDWLTPDLPLLKGTCRARLLEQGVIREAELGVEDLNRFKGLKLINALRDMSQPMIPIKNIIY